MHSPYAIYKPYTTSGTGAHLLLASSYGGHTTAVHGLQMYTYGCRLHILVGTSVIAYGVCSSAIANSLKSNAGPTHDCGLLGDRNLGTSVIAYVVLQLLTV